MKQHQKSLNAKKGLKMKTRKLGPGVDSLQPPRWPGQLHLHGQPRRALALEQGAIRPVSRPSRPKPAGESSTIDPGGSLDSACPGCPREVRWVELATSKWI